MHLTEDQRTIQQLAREFAQSELAPIAAQIDQEERIPAEIIEKMAAEGVATNVHYKPLPMMTAYKALGWNIADFPNTYDYYQNLITLPLHTKLSDEDVEYVCEVLRDVIKEYSIEI